MEQLCTKWVEAVSVAFFVGCASSLWIMLLAFLLRTYLTLHQASETALATVLSKHVVETSSGSNYYLGLSFHARLPDDTELVVHSPRHAISRKTYDSLTQATDQYVSVPILYVPNDPSQCVVATELPGELRLLRWTGLLVVLILAPMAIGVWGCFLWNAIDIDDDGLSTKRTALIVFGITVLLGALLSSGLWYYPTCCRSPVTTTNNLKSRLYDTI